MLKITTRVAFLYLQEAVLLRSEVGGGGNRAEAGGESLSEEPAEEYSDMIVRRQK